MNFSLLASAILFFSGSIELPAQAQTPTGLNGTSFELWKQGSGPFNFTDHYINNQTGVVLSLYAGPDRLRNFAPNFRGLSPQEQPFSIGTFKEWAIEYFCEPDYTLSIFGKHQNQHHYLADLRLDQSIWLDPKENQLFLTYMYKPSNGFLTRNPNMTPPLVSFSVEFSWHYQQKNVRATVTLQNLSPETHDYVFNAQDAAYLWFPNQSQVNLTSFLFENGKPLDSTYKTNSGVGNLFAGLFSEKHRVFSGFRTVKAILPPEVSIRSSVGVSRYYLNVPISVAIGYQLPLPSSIKDMDTQISLAMRSDSPLQNRFASFWVQNVKPNQAVVLVFDLIMGLVPQDQTLQAIIPTAIGR